MCDRLSHPKSSARKNNSLLVQILQQIQIVTRMRFGYWREKMYADPALPVSTANGAGTIQIINSKSSPDEPRAKFRFRHQLPSHNHSVMHKRYVQQHKNRGILQLFSIRTCVLQQLFAISNLHRAVPQPAEILRLL